MNALQKQADKFLRKDKRWRYDSNLFVSAVTEKFQQSLDTLVENRSKASGAKPSVLVKLHWAMCNVVQQASSERLEDDTRLLDFIIANASDEDELSDSLDVLSVKEESALKEVVRELDNTLPSIQRLTDVRPVTGSLAKPPRIGGRFRKASALGVDGRLVETTGRELVTRLLAAHG